MAEPEQTPLSPKEPAADNKVKLDPDELYPPVKVRGTTFRILTRGLQITTKGSCFKRGTQSLLPWDGLHKCDLQFGCFSGTLILQPRTGEPHILSGRIAMLREVANVIYQQMNMGHCGKIEPEIVRKLGKSPKVTILGNGLVVKKKIGCCSGVAAFVPWGSVVFAEVAQGWCSGAITLKTMIHQDDVAPPDKKGAQPVAPAADSKTNADASTKALAVPDPTHHEGPQFVSVTIPGKKEALQEVFGLIVKLMCSQSEDAEVEDAPKIPKTTMTKAGIKVKTRSKEQFLPWRSISSVEWSKPAIGSATLMLTDRIGDEMGLRGCGLDEYNAFKALYARLGGEDDSGGHQAIVRKNCRIAWDGVSVPHKSLCSYKYSFYPWSEIDACEMEVTCFGGSLVLVTETGERFVVCTSRFSQRTLFEAMEKIRYMKYHGAASPDTTTARFFAGEKDTPNVCVLTDVSLRIAAKTGRYSHIVCYLDLQQVRGIGHTRAGGSCCKHTYLLVYVNRLMGAAVNIDNILAKDSSLRKPEADERVLMVKLRKGDDAKSIAQDIMTRSMARKQSESSRFN
mmetsp:Transcript_63251/g.137589  ORF Transcript_63251/g.137589 Transcript_63251/m.137589 type:complete len:566 (-) Transcript_63251:168-1865(-)